MSNQQTIVQLLRLAGVRLDRVTPAQIQEIETVLQEAAQDPVTVAARWLRARRECEQAAAAAKEMREILEGMLRGPAALCVCEGLLTTPQGPAARVRWRGDVLELAIHPEVDIARLRDLEPWEPVRVHTKEQVLIGVADDAGARARALGEVVEMRGWHADGREQVHVARVGGQEDIVQIARCLRDEPLRPGDRLVLSREAPGWAIARAASISSNSRFEVGIDSVAVDAEDVAGLEPVLEPLLEAIELRLLADDVRGEFALEPLHGVLLWSLKPGEGKTLLTRLVATWLRDVGATRGFDVVLYVVKPNELKSMWHGEDARLVREDLCGSIRARQAVPRTRPIVQIVVMDEIDCLGRRAGGHDGGELLSSAHNDAIQALLVELDGLVRTEATPRAHVLWLGLTNRPDAVDPALKRPGRLGDLVLEMPPLGAEAAAKVMAVYAPAEVPWLIDGDVRHGVAPAVLEATILRPALATILDTVVLRYGTEPQRSIDVTAGTLLSAVHYREAMSQAKLRGARRRRSGIGFGAVGLDDVVAGLVDQACAAASAMEADWITLQRLLRVRGRIQRVETVPRDEVGWQRDLVGPVVGERAVGDRAAGEHA